MAEIHLEPSWEKVLSSELDKEYFEALIRFVSNEYESQTVFPREDQVLKALNKTPFTQVKVVILGQDPYHGQGQANGLAFSVNEGVALPPSLKNIFKEIQNDLGKPLPNNGNLDRWAEQGVLLLNATLTVRKSEAGSHQGKGWEKFTDTIIQKLSSEKDNLVFMLWGNFAERKSKLIDESKHLILRSAHPSPLSAYRGFFGNHHFSKANSFLKENGKSEIDW